MGSIIEDACLNTENAVVLPTENLPFEQIPHQSRLFLDYLNKPFELREFYPNAIPSHTSAHLRVPETLANYKTDRKLLCDALAEMNRECGAGEKTLQNIELLRDADCVTVVSGQQAGLFTGPLYTIFKALSAVKLAKCLSGRGFKAVPVFWIATEDHDFAEVSWTQVIDKSGNTTTLKNEPSERQDNLPVGFVKLDDSITQTIDELFAALPETEFSVELRELVESCWKSGENYSAAFTKMLTKLLGDYGLILLCPMDETMKKLAAPIYVKAIEKSAEIVYALQTRSRELVEKGYHAQVLITDDYFPLFWQARDNTRHALKRTPEGKFKAKDTEREFTLAELAELAAENPQRFSPNVVLRSVVQDYLLPTVAYFGGAAEVAYFAQSGETYRILERPVTTILARASLSIVEPRQQRTLEEYDLKLTDIFVKQDELLAHIVEKFLNSKTAQTFAEVEEEINRNLNKLERSLSQSAPTLAESSVRRRQKILYHIGALRKKYHRAELRKHEVVTKRIEDLYAALYPKNGLQERSLNITSLYARHGKYLIDWIYNAIDLDENGHQIVYL